MTVPILYKMESWMLPILSRFFRRESNNGKAGNLSGGVATIKKKQLPIFSRFFRRESNNGKAGNLSGGVVTIKRSNAKLL